MSRTVEVLADERTAELIARRIHPLCVCAGSGLSEVDWCSGCINLAWEIIRGVLVEREEVR